MRTEEGKYCAEGQHVHVKASAKGKFADNIQIRLKDPQAVGFCPQQVLEYLYGTLDEGHYAIVPAGLEELIDIIHQKKTKITKLISLRFGLTTMEREADDCSHLGQLLSLSKRHPVRQKNPAEGNVWIILKL